MKLQRIYIDTSVVGGCFDVEFAKWSNGLIEDFKLGNFKLVLSDLIESELEHAPEKVQDIYDDLLSLNCDVVTIEQSMTDLAHAYLQHDIITPKYYDDGLHIAIATVAEVDILVSWNFKHMVHYNKIRLFNAVNAEYGYKPIQIYSPREVTIYGAD